MEIIKREVNIQSFGATHLGQTFLKDGDVYIKVELFDCEGDEFNCVRLQDGDFAWIPVSEKVEVVSCKLYAE